MPVTGLRGRQILDGDVFRNDLNITTSGSAVTRRIVAGTNIGISSTGVDTGTGDVTINISGQVSVANGGTGAATLTGVLIGNGTGAITGVTGTASQLLRRNAGNTAYEFFTHTFANTTGDTFTGVVNFNDNITFAQATSPFTRYIQFGDNTGWIFRFMTSVSGTPTERFSFSDVGQFKTSGTWSQATGNGQIYLNGTTGNRIEFNTAGVAPPSYTTRSAGTKMVFYPAVSASSVDYAIGIDSSTLWFSVPDSSQIMSWYYGNTKRMQLDSAGLNIYTPAGNTSLYLTDQTNSTLYITHPTSATVRFFNGSATQWLQEVGGNVTIGASTSAPSKLFIFNTNTGQQSLRITQQSNLTSLQTTIPLQIYDSYNSGANGHQLTINSTASAGVWEYNITKTWGGILTFGSSTDGTSHKRDLYIYDSGQLRFTNYTSTTSFTGTAAGVLAFTSDGSIITIATPGGGSGLTGTGTTNYISKFTGGTSLGNSQIIDNGTNVGINQASPQAKLHITPAVGFNALQLDCGSSYEILFGGGNTANIYHGDLNQVLYINTNGGAIYMGCSNAGATLQITSSVIQATIPLVVSSNAAQIKITGGATDVGILMSSTNSILYIADWTNLTNGILVNVANGVLITRTSSTSGAYIQFERGGSTAYAYVGCASAMFTGGVNTDLGIRSEGGIKFGSGNTIRGGITSAGQLQLNAYTTTTSFTGTIVGYLAYDSSGNVICSTGSGGGGGIGGTGTTNYIPKFSASTTLANSVIFDNGTDIGINTATPTTTTNYKTLHIVGGSAGAIVRFSDSTASNCGYIYGSTAETAINAPIGFNIYTNGSQRLNINNAGQLRFLNYTAYNSFSNTDAQGILGFDTNGQIITLYAPIYRQAFVAGAPVTANNVPVNISFFNSSNSYVTTMDLTGKKRARLIARVTTAATAGTILRVRYAATFSTTASSYLTMGSSEIEVAISTTGVLDSGWINLVAGAKIGVCYIALLTQGGDGATDPVVAQVHFEAEE